MVVLVKELKSLQRSSQASSTFSKYASSRKTWCTWSSSSLHVPQIIAKPLHVALFLTEMFLSCIEKGAGSLALESAVYAIRWVHHTASSNSPTGPPSRALHSRGCKKKAWTTGESQGSNLLRTCREALRKLCVQLIPQTSTISGHPTRLRRVFYVSTSCIH